MDMSFGKKNSRAGRVQSECPTTGPLRLSRLMLCYSKFIYEVIVGAARDGTLASSCGQPCCITLFRAWSDSPCSVSLRILVIDSSLIGRKVIALIVSNSACVLRSLQEGRRDLVCLLRTFSSLPCT